MDQNKVMNRPLGHSLQKRSISLKGHCEAGDIAQKPIISETAVSPLYWLKMRRGEEREKKKLKEMKGKRIL